METRDDERAERAPTRQRSAASRALQATTSASRSAEQTDRDGGLTVDSPLSPSQQPSAESTARTHSKQPETQSALLAIDANDAEQKWNQQLSAFEQGLFSLSHSLHHSKAFIHIDSLLSGSQ